MSNKGVQNCESCEFYDYDEYLDAYVCSVSLDEDEMVNFLGKNNTLPKGSGEINAEFRMQSAE